MKSIDNYILEKLIINKQLQPQKHDINSEICCKVGVWTFDYDPKVIQQLGIGLITVNIDGNKITETDLSYVNGNFKKESKYKSAKTFSRTKNDYMFTRNTINGLYYFYLNEKDTVKFINNLPIKITTTDRGSFLTNDESKKMTKYVNEFFGFEFEISDKRDMYLQRDILDYGEQFLKDIIKYLDRCIVEKLVIDKTVGLNTKIDLKPWYLMFHKTFVESQNRLYIEDIIKIKDVDVIHGVLKLLPYGWGGTIDKKYITINEHTVLGESIYDTDLVALLPKDEALQVLKKIKDTESFDIKEYFDSDDKVEIRKDSSDHKITYKEINDIIKELEDKK